MRIFPDLRPEMTRVASLLTLRDRSGRIVAAAADNGNEGSLEDYHGKGLQASDLLLLSSIGEGPLKETDQVLAPGVTAYGAKLSDPALQPRAGTWLLPGENLAFYVEVYNLGLVKGYTDAELLTSVEKLKEDGTLDYAFSLSGQAQTLKHEAVNQWNIVRSFGLGGLASGHYRLIVDVRDDTDNDLVQRNVDFRIVDWDDLINLYGWRSIGRPGE